MRKAHFDLEQRAIQMFGEFAVSQGKKLQEAADMINELLKANQESHEYIDRLTAQGKNLSQFNQALREINAEHEKELARLNNL